MKQKIFFTIFLLFLISISALSGQATLLPGEEAPSSIFSSKIGDADVDLYVSGFWKTNLDAGFGISWDSSGSSIVSTPFPGFSGTPVFSQEPDITLSLWLKNQYFFETSFIDNFALNTILFGYNAANENDFLQQVRIGNTDIGMGNYSLFTLPAASTDSLGAMAKFSGPHSQHQIAVRFDPAEKAEKSFRGAYEINKTRIPLNGYVKGSFFILPDDNVDNLHVYIEDSSGLYTDGSSHYRLATDEDAVISAVEGYVFFRKPQNVKIAVHYTKNGKDVGDSTLGKNALSEDSGGEIDISGLTDFNFVKTYLNVDMNTLKTTINSETALILYQPGQFSPFELLSVYPLPYNFPAASTPFDALLVNKNLDTGEKTTFQAGIQDKTIMFVRNNDNSLRNPANKYPFADKISNGVSLYGQSSLISGQPSDKELLIEKYDAVTAYNLGDSVLDGSVELLKNGQADNRFTFNPATGNVTLLFPVAADDRLDFYYRTKAAASQGGDLVGGIGNRFRFSDALTAEIGAGLRWNVSKGSYTENRNEAPGSLLASAGAAYTTKNLKIALDGGVSFYNPDTTGIFRLLGMDKEGFPIAISENMLYPAAASTILSLSQASRGKLLYKDYHLYNSLGSSVLKNYNWTNIPAAQEYPYENGGRTGPYAAGSNGEIEGNTAVFDYSLDNGQWVGGRVPLTLESEGLDLSAIESISLKVKLINSTGSIKTSIRLGHLGEDLDGDGILDRETAPFEKGFTFNPVFNSSTYSMKVGSSPDGKTGNGQIDSEDLDGNEILDPETADTIVTLSGGTDYTEPAADSSWKTITIQLTPDDRAKLRNVTGFEIIIQDTGSSSSGRLLVGDIHLMGSSFVVTPEVSQQVNAEEGSESLLNQGGSTLESDFPEVKNWFSSAETVQNIGEFSWNGAGTWSATAFTQPVNLGDYKKLTFYMKTPSPTPAAGLDSTIYSTAISLLNPAGQGIKIYFTPTASNTWQKYTFDYTTGELFVDGQKKAVLVARNDNSAENVQKFILLANCTAAGTLYLDEVHLESSVFGVSAGITSQFTYKHPGVLIAAGNTPVISDFTFINNSRLAGNNFATGFSAPQETNVYTSSSVGFSLFSLRLDGSLAIQKEPDAIYYSPGWSINMPFFQQKLILKDSYQETNGETAQSVSREDTTQISAGNSEFSFGTQSQSGTISLQQNWNAKWNLGTSPFTLDTSLILGTITPVNPYAGKTLAERIEKSYELFIPVTFPFPQRSINFDMNGKFKPALAPITIDEKMATSTTGTTDRKITSTQHLTLGIPITFNEGTSKEWKLTPSYSRLLSASRPPPKDISFYTDALSALHTTASQSYYFTSIPLYELILDSGPSFSDVSKGLDSALYKPEFSLTFSHQSGNSFADIFIPASAEASIQRTQKREWDSLSDTKSFSFTFVNSVFNLYGKLGSHPFFTWYQSEEYTGKSGIKVSASSPETTTATLYKNDFLNFIIRKDYSLSLESTLSFAWLPLVTNGTLITTYNWIVPLNRTIKIPVIAPEGETKSFFSHKESFTVSYRYDDTIFEFDTTFTLKHSSDFVIGSRGKLSAYAGIGFSRKEITSGSASLSYMQLGFEAGITARINF